MQNDKLFTLLSSNPSSAFRTIKSAKSLDTVQVPFEKVGDKIYRDNRVIDGLFKSIEKHKTEDPHQLSSSPHHSSIMQDFYNIKFLCSTKIKIYSITAYHYIKAGLAGLVHFDLLLNAFIVNVTNTTMVELNKVLALLPYKGHKKARALDSSYSTKSHAL